MEHSTVTCTVTDGINEQARFLRTGYARIVKDSFTALLTSHATARSCLNGGRHGDVAFDPDVTALHVSGEHGLPLFAATVHLSLRRASRAALLHSCHLRLGERRLDLRHKEVAIVGESSKDPQSNA